MESVQNPTRSVSSATLQAALFELRRLVHVHGSTVAAGHPWFLEHDRWRELAFAITACTSPEADEEHLRSWIGDMDALGLLDVAEIIANDDCAAWTARCHRVAKAAGLDPSRLERALAAIHGAAGTLARSHNGHVAHLLRIHTERMLQGLMAEVALGDLSPSERSRSLTYWLQNVLCAPLPLADESTDRFLNDHGLDAQALVNAADQLGINVAMVDDLIRHDQDVYDALSSDGSTT
jgi:hypothetical protein